MIYLVLYISTIWLANWALGTFGLVPVGWGLMAPAGVYFVGAGFTLRDMVQERLGKRWVLVGIAGGVILSALISPQFALASGAAFGLSELADFAVYTPLRARSWWGAVLASNTVGLVVDSALFLWLAFGSLDFIWGQIVGKWEVTALTVALIAIRRHSAVSVNAA